MKKKERTQPVTGANRSNDERLAQCREERRDVRVVLCQWYPILHLSVQTCVHLRIPRLLWMATSDEKPGLGTSKASGRDYQVGWNQHGLPTTEDCPRLVDLDRVGFSLSRARVNSICFEIWLRDLKTIILFIKDNSYHRA